MTVEGTVTILLDRKKASVPRVANETLLESARRAGPVAAVQLRGGQLRHLHGQARPRARPPCGSTTRWTTTRSARGTSSPARPFRTRDVGHASTTTDRSVLVQTRRRPVLGLVARDLDRAAHQPEIPRGHDDLGRGLQRLGQRAHRGGRDAERTQPRLPALRACRWPAPRRRRRAPRRAARRVRPLSESPRSRPPRRTIARTRRG